MCGKKYIHVYCSLGKHFSCNDFEVEVLVLRSHVTPLFTDIRRNMEDSTGSNPQSPGFTEKLKSWLSWSWTYVCFLWFGMVLIMIYVLWSPLKLQETLTSGELRQMLASYCQPTGVQLQRKLWFDSSLSELSRHEQWRLSG